MQRQGGFGDLSTQGVDGPDDVLHVNLSELTQRMQRGHSGQCSSWAFENTPIQQDVIPNLYLQGVDGLDDVLQVDFSWLTQRMQRGNSSRCLFWAFGNTTIQQQGAFTKFVIAGSGWAG